MSVKIGHASIDENGKAKGGAAGDQTGKEVYIRDWYDKGWTKVLRPKTEALAEKLAKACEAGCNNSTVGYDQNQRNTLRTQAKKAGFDLSKIKTKCETDCSAFMTVCAECAGVDMDSAYTNGNAPTTSTMVNKFKATGKFSVLEASKYLKNDEYLKRGDILVKPGSHTAMVLSDGSKVSQKTSVSDSGSFKVKVICSLLNVRKSSNADSKILSIIKNDETYTVVGVVNGWYKLKEKSGWVNSKFVKRI